MNWKYNNRNKTKKRRLNSNNKNEDEDEEETPKLSTNSVDIVNNSIYYFTDVTTKSSLDLIKALETLDNKLQNLKNTHDMDDVKINLHISTYGGEIFAAFAIIDKILTIKTPVHSYINGISASAGTLISVVCDKRYAYKHSYMLIHQLSSCFWGKFNEIEDDFENNKTFMEDIKKIYKEHTNLKNKQLDKILVRDIWWNSKICLENGLIDEILN